MPVTSRQQEIVDYIFAFQMKHGYSPSLREICSALELSSPGSLTKHIRRLESAGLIRRVAGKKRAWSVTNRSPVSVIPLVGRIAAGTPILAEVNKEDDLPIDPMLFGAPDAFALRVQGDSMIGVHIREGDIAVIRPQDDADDGSIVAVMVEGIETEATLKILRRKPAAIELVAANHAYQPMIFRDSDRARVKIIGKLVGIIRQAN